GCSTEAGWVFPSTAHADRPISDTYVRHLVWDVGNAAGLHRLRPHLFRHSAATELLERTGNLRTVQEFLGHADPKTTAIYARVRPARLREAVQLMSFEGGRP